MPRVDRSAPAAWATQRRYLRELLKRERYVSERLGRAARGSKAPLHLGHVRRFVAEAGALAWALGELERLYPEAGARARADLEREDLAQR